jgi:hypothetical protein
MAFALTERHLLKAKDLADDLLVLEPGQAVTHTWGLQAEF